MSNTNIFATSYFSLNKGVASAKNKTVIYGGSGRREPITPRAGATANFPPPLKAWLRTWRMKISYGDVLYIARCWEIMGRHPYYPFYNDIKFLSLFSKMQFIQACENYAYDILHFYSYYAFSSFKCYLCDASFDSRFECLNHKEQVHPSDWHTLKDKNKVKFLGRIFALFVGPR